MHGRTRPARRRRDAGPDILIEHRQALEPDIYLIDSLPAAAVRARPRGKMKLWKPGPRFGVRLMVAVLAGAAAAAFVLPSSATRTSSLYERAPAILSANDPGDRLAAEILEGDLSPPAKTALARSEAQGQPIAR